LDLKDGIPPFSALSTAFERQRGLRGIAPGLTFTERQDALAGLAALLRGNAAEIAAAVGRDFRARAVQETQLLEIFPALEGIAHARRHLRAWMRPRRARTNFWFLPGRSRVMMQPLGVAGIVVPWNYPIYLAVGPATAALAAGNRVMIKMSESAPATGELLAELVARRFAPEVLAVVNGGPEVAREFTALPFDHLLFTGSTEVGRHVMRAAAANLTPVTLELGGKSPAIVGRGIDVAEAADRILFGKCLNAGQTCVAPDYALVPRERMAAFAQAAAATVSRLYPRLVDNPDYTAIIDERHRLRLVEWRDEARALGASVTELKAAGEDFAASPKLPPTLITGAPAEARVMREEIFGPLLPLVPYDTTEDAIAYVNARPRPLALYVFDRDSVAIERVLAATVSGGASVNETILHLAQDDLPFGGVGPSGMGEYHGRAGFESFSKKKAVFYQSRLNGLKLFQPPYGKRFDALLRLLSR
jgi:acyl-CoA reductase-like NAD-dependent aldehyde dehydrogenase